MTAVKHSRTTNGRHVVTLYDTLDQELTLMDDPLHREQLVIGGPANDDDYWTLDKETAETLIHFLRFWLHTSVLTETTEKRG